MNLKGDVKDKQAGKLLTDESSEFNACVLVVTNCHIELMIGCY